uniref:Flavodoxin-like domain-containing protein n=1 Tax=Oncorhynchus tshawytscha TaxID=74940 RepID=A0A8C8HAZ6_ONCTS
MVLIFRPVYILSPIFSTNLLLLLPKCNLENCLLYSKCTNYMTREQQSQRFTDNNYIWPIFLMKNVKLETKLETTTVKLETSTIFLQSQYFWICGMSADLEEYDMSELPRLVEINNSLAVFCMATYGEGDPTDNAQDFYDWMQETNGELNRVNFAVFGLGNKTYEHLNAMGKYTDKRLEELGGRRIYDLGMGDDDGTLEEDFVSWKEQFWPAVCEHFGVEQDELVFPTDINMNKVYTGEMGRLKTGDRHLMHLELDISGSQIRYDSGDHVAVYPINDVSIVNRIGQIMDADLDTHPFPCPTTYRTALTHYLSWPSTNCCLSVSLCQGLYQSWVLDSQRNILAVLEDMPSLHPTIDHLCELLHRLQARYYSIASSGELRPTIRKNNNTLSILGRNIHLYSRAHEGRENPSLLCALCKYGCHLSFPRDARNTPRDVQNAFYDIAEEVGGLTLTQAVAYIKKLMTKGCYSQDVWS